MKSTTHHYIVAISAFLAILPCTSLAQSNDWTALDFAMLPEVCSAKLRSDVRDNKQIQHQWEKKVGSNIYLHVHHYCFGFWAQQKALTAPDRYTKKRALRDCVRELQYVLNRWPSNSPYFADAQSRQQLCAFNLKIIGD